MVILVDFIAHNKYYDRALPKMAKSSECCTGH